MLQVLKNIFVKGLRKSLLYIYRYTHTHTHIRAVELVLRNFAYLRVSACILYAASVLCNGSGMIVLNRGITYFISFEIGRD
jgi:hypothetical protein